MWTSYIKREVTNITTVLDSGNIVDFENKLESFAFNNNIYAELINGDGKSIYSTGSSCSAGKMPMVDSEEKEDVIKEVLGGKEVNVPVTQPQIGNEFVLMGLPIKNSGEISKGILIITSLAPMEDTAEILKGQLVYITILLLIASLMISFPIAFSFANPILEIKKVAEKMAGGDFTARIKLTRKPKKRDEIGKLAETVNNMGEQLSKIDQLRKDLIANVSHDLRTPLSLIRGYAETIKDVTGDNPEKRDRQLGVIIEETERLGKIVDDILNLSQLQSGNVKLSKTSFNINALINTALNSYDILTEKTGVELLQMGAADVDVVADEVRIGQVIHNLINNGFNHTPSGGKITVNTIVANETVRIEISDTGKGISQEALPHIWERYYKADKTTGKKTTGTGLGLAIVKGIMEAHQSEYGVESEKGVGTTFWFELKRKMG